MTVMRRVRKPGACRAAGEEGNGGIPERATLSVEGPESRCVRRRDDALSL